MAHKTIYLPVMEPPPVPKTAAQRKAEQRARDKRAVADAIGLESLADVRTLAMLLRESITKGVAHEQRAAYRAWLEIGKKQGWLHGKKIIDPLDTPTLLSPPPTAAFGHKEIREILDGPGRDL